MHAVLSLLPKAQKLNVTHRKSN